MATIYNYFNGRAITGGLQGCTVSDSAIRAARVIAATRQVGVWLEDDDGCWVIESSGRKRPPSAAEYRAMGYTENNYGEWVFDSELED